MYICIIQVVCSCEVNCRWGFVPGKWRARLSQKFVARWYVWGGYMEVPGVVLLSILVIYVQNEYHECCYVCVMEMCLGRRVLCTPLWSQWCPFQSGLQWFSIIDTSGCEWLPYRVFCTPQHVSPTVAEGILCVGTERGNTGRRKLVKVAGNDWIWAECWKTLMIVSEILLLIIVWVSLRWLFVEVSL